MKRPNFSHLILFSILLMPLTLKADEPALSSPTGVGAKGGPSAGTKLSIGGIIQNVEAMSGKPINVLVTIIGKSETNETLNSRYLKVGPVQIVAQGSSTSSKIFKENVPAQFMETILAVPGSVITANVNAPCGGGAEERQVPRGMSAPSLYINVVAKGCK